MILPFSILCCLCIVFIMGIISNSQCNHHEEIKLCSKICLKTIMGHFPMYYISYTVGYENYTLRRKKTQIICHYGFFLLDISLICVPIFSSYIYILKCSIFSQILPNIFSCNQWHYKYHFTCIH